MHELLSISLNKEISETEKVFYELSKIYNKLPILDSAKKSFIKNTLKEKSAWYSCIVNPNIDILLLPDYIESHQTRNILLKKETEQFLNSIQQFDALVNKNKSDLYECLLFEEQSNNLSMSFDLFSSNVSKTEICPPNLKQLFEQWEIEFNEGTLASILLLFTNWHQSNNFSFNAQRQIILWINFELWKKFGSIAFQINIEKYFYHHWNKEGRSIEICIKEFNQFLYSEVIKTKNQLRDLFRDSIQFEHLKTPQKIASNFLFNSSFETSWGIEFQNNVTINKTLLKKGFVSLEDLIQNKENKRFETVLIQLLEEKKIRLKKDKNEVCLIISTDYSQQSRLKPYENTLKIESELAISDFFEQNINLLEEKEVLTIEFTPEQILEIKPEIKKAFFG